MPKIVFAILAMLTLAACNTVRGAGQDVQSAGDAISDQATETQSEMSILLRAGAQPRLRFRCRSAGSGRLGEKLALALPDDPGVDERAGACSPARRVCAKPSVRPRSGRSIRSRTRRPASPEMCRDPLAPSARRRPARSRTARRPAPAACAPPACRRGG